MLDEDSDQPIPGAIVVATWDAGRSNWFTDSYPVCLHVETSRADTQGRYRLPDWHGWWLPNNWFLFGRILNIGAYKMGYQRSIRQRPTDTTIFLKSFRGTATPPFDQPRVGFMTCGPGVDESEMNLYRLWTAVVDDEEARAVTNEHRDKVRQDREAAANYLVNHRKPTFTNSSGRIVNVDPKDSYKPDDLLK